MRSATAIATMICSAYPTLESFYAAIYKPRRLLGCSPTTDKHYRVAIRHLDRYFGRQTTLADIADEDRCADFMEQFSEGRQPATIATQRSQMIALLTLAHRRGMIAIVPDIPTVAQYRDAPDSLTVAEMYSLINAAMSAEGNVCGVPAQYYWTANFLIVYDTGVRTRALYGIETCQLRLDTPAIIFPPENMKNRHGMILRISSSTAAIIRRCLAPRRRLLFPEPWCEATRYSRVRDFFRAAGLPCGHRDLYQKLRRTTATMTHEHGGDACAQLGHSSDSVTRKHYIDPSHTIQAADLLDHPWAESIQAADRQGRLF